MNVNDRLLNAFPRHHYHHHHWNSVVTPVNKATSCVYACVYAREQHKPRHKRTWHEPRSKFSAYGTFFTRTIEIYSAFDALNQPNHIAVAEWVSEVKFPLAYHFSHSINWRIKTIKWNLFTVQIFINNSRKRFALKKNLERNRNAFLMVRWWCRECGSIETFFYEFCVIDKQEKLTSTTSAAENGSQIKMNQPKPWEFRWREWSRK